MLRFLIFSLLLSSLSFARSRVGEWASYNYESITEASSVKGLLTKEIISEKKEIGPDGKMATWLQISEKFSTPGQAIVENFKWEIDTQIFNPFELNLYMLGCRFSRAMGNLEKIRVTAGVFKACKINGQDNWIGVVPFSHILYILNDGKRFKRYELVNYSWKVKK